MKLHLGIALVVLLPSIGLAQEQQTDREQADKVRAVAEIASFAVGIRNAAPTKLTVDVEDETYLAVTVTDRQGEELALEFEPNQTSPDVLRPILPEGTEPEIFGQQFFGFGPAFLLSSTLTGKAPKAPKEELLPFDTAVVQQPHDDVSIFVVSEELVLIRLWHGGRLLGTYYAVDMDAPVQGFEAEQAEDVESGKAVGGVAQSGSNRVCGILYKICIAGGTDDLARVIACIGWLAFCTA